MVLPTSEPVIGQALVHNVRLTDDQLRVLCEIVLAQPHDPTNHALNALRAQLVRLSNGTA